MTDLSAAWRALAIGAAGFVLVGFNGTATNIAFDDITETFSSVPESTTAFVASGYFIGQAAFLPLAGRIADRRGRVGIFQLGVLLFALSSAISAIAPTVWILIAARVLQAIGGALVIPASLSMVLPLFPEGRRATAVTTWASAGPISAAISPSLSAFVLEVSSWRWLFLVSAPLGIAIWLLGRRVLVEAEVERPTGRLDVLGSALGTIAIALLVLGIGKGGDWGWRGPLVIGCFVVAAVTLAGFVRQTRVHPEPLIDLSIFRARQVWLANVANTFVSVTSLSIWLVWPLFLQRVWDYSSLQVGLALTPGPIAAATTSLLAGRIADRIGHRLPIQIGSLIMVFAVGWCWLALPADGSYFTGFVPGIAAFGFGWGLSSPTMNSFALEAVPEAQWGSMNAAFNMLRNVAGAVGIAAAVGIVGSRDRHDLVEAFDRAFLFFFVFTALAAALLLIGYPSGAARGRPHNP
ncbi:MAG: MFS transporter [Actinomycetota bacterium]